MAQYTDPELFIFLDESAVDQSTAERMYGCSTIGTRCVRRASFVRGIRHSVLPALSCDGIIAMDIFAGSVTKDVAKIGIFGDNKDLSLILIFVFCIDLPKVAHIIENKFLFLIKIFILNKVPT